MPRTIFHKSYKTAALACLPSKAFIHQIADKMYDVYVFPLVVTADIVDFAWTSPLQHGFHGNRVILDMQPVAYIQAITVDRERLFVDDVVDHERDQLLWKMIRTVVVGTAGIESRHPVGLVVGTYQEVRTGFARRVGRIGGKRRIFGKKACRAERAIDLVRGDLQVAESGDSVRLPVFSALLKKDLGPEHVGFDKDLGSGNGAVYVGFCRKVDDCIHLLRCKKICYQRCIADVAPYKPVVWAMVHPFQVLKVSCIGKQVEVGYPASGISRHEAVDEVRPDKSGAAGNEYRFEAALHMLTSKMFIYKNLNVPSPERLKLSEYSLLSILSR